MFCHSGLLPAGRQVTRNPVFVLAGSRLGGRDDTKNYVRRTYRAPLVVPSFFTILPRDPSILEVRYPQRPLEITQKTFYFVKIRSPG